MAKKELKLHAVVSPTETVVVSAYDETGKAEACTLAFYDEEQVQYLAVGEKVADAFRTGMELKKSFDIIKTR